MRLAAVAEMMFFEMMFLLSVCQGVDVSRCCVSGRGIQPTGIRVNDLAVFRVSTFNAGKGDLDVILSRSKGDQTQELPVRVVEVGIFCSSGMYVLLWCTVVSLSFTRVIVWLATREHAEAASVCLHL